MLSGKEMVVELLLGEHSGTQNGGFRRERGDSTAGTLREDYPEFEKVRTDAQLRNIRKNLGLPDDASINDVRKALRKLDD